MHLLLVGPLLALGFSSPLVRTAAPHASRSAVPRLQQQQQQREQQQLTTSDKVGVVVPTGGAGFSYAQFAKENPLVNNLGIATAKTAAADLLAQLVIAQTPVQESQRPPQNLLAQYFTLAMQLP